MADVSFEDMVGEIAKEPSIEDMVSPREVSFESMVGVAEPTFITPATDAPRPSTYPKTLYEMQAEVYEPLVDGIAEDSAAKQSLMGTLRDVARKTGMEAVAASELALSLASGIVLYLPSKAYGVMALPFGKEAADIAEEEIAKLGYQPFTEKGRRAAEMVGKGFEWFLSPARSVDDLVSRVNPELGYLAEFGAEMAEFITTGGIVRGVRARFKPSIEQAIKLTDAKKELESARIEVKEQAIEGIPDEAMKKAQRSVLEAEKVQVELEDAKAKETVVKQDLKVKGEEVKTVKSGVTIDEAAKVAAEEMGVEYEGTTPEGYVPEGHMFNLTEKTDPMFKGRETTISVKDLKDLPEKVKGKIQEFREPKEVRPERIEPKKVEIEKALKGTGKYTPHGTDMPVFEGRMDISAVEGILKEGIRPGSSTGAQASGYPIVFLFDKGKLGERPVPHRPGDFTTTKTAKPTAVIVDPSAYITTRPSKVVEAELTKRLTELEGKGIPPEDAYVKDRAAKRLADELEKAELEGPFSGEMVMDRVTGLAEEYNVSVYKATLGPEGEVVSAKRAPRLEVPRETEIDWFGEKEAKALVELEKITEVDRQTGVEVPEIKGERSPFYQTAEEAEVFRKLYEERLKAVSESVELFTQKLINDANRGYHGDTTVDVAKARDGLSELATRADELRMDFLDPKDHLAWKETVSDAAEWARGLRSEIEQRGDITLYAGVPLDAMQKAIVDGAKRFKGYVEHARGIKRFKPLDAARLLNQEFKRSFIDRSGNIRLELLDKLGDAGYDIVQKMYLTKGANSLAASALKQMRKEVYSGLDRAEKAVLDKVVLAERMADIGKYKTEKEFKFPEGLKPTETAAYLELFPQLEKLTPDRAQLIGEKARAYFEWMKRPLKDMLDAELITQEEYNNLASHNYRRIKLVDIFDKRYSAKIGRRKRTVYDSGVEALAKGRTTDIYEPSSEIMALEVFNRAYGRILNNEANRALLDLARSDPKNPFVRHRAKGQSVPSGWQRFFVYEEGQRKAIYLSPDMAKEWIVNNPEISYRMGQFLRYASGSPVLRTFATGINWGFALANLPRDVMHTYFAARMFNGKEWESVYSPHLPIFLPQIGADLARVFVDAATRGPRYQEYIKEGGGMEFLVHQGRPFARGRRLEGPVDKIMDFMGYFGETSEIMTRLAIRDRVIRRRAREQKISVEEARKNKDITREATFAARDYMDFGQGGGITKAADNAMPYLNAAVQGTRGLWRTAVDNPALFSYKIAQIGAATTLLYAAMRNHAPKTTESLQGSVAMQNNICIPLGDGFSFEDDKGQTRYIYFKIPLDPSQKFFKTFFEGAYDKYAGHEVDVERITNNLLEQSPVGTSSLPPTLSGTLGYMYNKDFWLNEDIWKKTDRPFDWPASKEEYVPGVTPEAFIDLGDITGISPERAQYAVEELTTSGTLWSYLMGEGYDTLFADVPKEKKEQHIAMTLSEVPVVKRFIGVTNPYSKHAAGIDEAAEKVTIDHWKQRRELDRLTEGYLFEKSVERKEVSRYIRSFKELRVRDRLQDRFDFQYAVRNLPERSFWLRLQHLDPEVRAERYYAREQAASPEERKRLARERATIGAAGGFFSDTFWDELNKLRRGKEVLE